MSRSTARKHDSETTAEGRKIEGVVKADQSVSINILGSGGLLSGKDRTIMNMAPSEVRVHGIAVPVVPFRTELVIEAAGSVTAAADLLGVSKSQPTRWRKGEAVPSPEKARLLNDLEHVFSRAAMIFEPPVIKQWMNGSNDYLEGARPIDVLKTRGVSEVLDALDAAEQIAYGG